MKRIFSSKREKRLWIIVAVVVFAIYSTIGLANTIMLELREYGLDFWLFLFGIFLVMISIITRGLTQSPQIGEIALAMGVVAVISLVFVRMSLVTERSHLIEYGIVAIFILEALNERKANRTSLHHPWILAILATILIGIIDEVIQIFVPNRVFDWYDILFNAFSAIFAVGLSLGLSYIRRKVSKN